jgi:hypothetical protein
LKIPSSPAESPKAFLMHDNFRSENLVVQQGSRWCGCCAQTLPGAVVPRNAALGVAYALARPIEKWAFIATNAAYYVAAYLIVTNQPLDAPIIESTRSMCDSPLVFGAIVFLLASMSTYWHGAQVQLHLPPCLEWIYCNGKLLSVPWLKRLMLADISCASFTVVIGMVCFGGPVRVFSWLGIPLVFFVVGRVAKQRQLYVTYAVIHGLWHILSAFAIWGIVLDGRTLFVGGRGGMEDVGV